MDREDWHLISDVVALFFVDQVGVSQCCSQGCALRMKCFVFFH